MKSKTYFIGAVSISLLLPVIFGFIYFKDLYDTKNENTKVASLYNRPEIIYTQSEKITKIENVIIEERDYLNAASYEFEVTYTKGQNPTSLYNLILDDIYLSEDIEKSKLKWKLLFLDYNTNKYIEINSGSLENVQNNFLNISNNTQIGINNIHRYKFYYYFSTDTEQDFLDISNCKFEAKIKIY